jgi:hypothetical protein
MKSKHIPANLEAAQKAAQMIKDQLADLEKSTATKKRPSLQDTLNRERLQGLLIADALTDDEMSALSDLHDAKKISKKIKNRLSALNRLTKAELAERLARAEIEIQVEKGYAGVINRALDELWHKFDGDEYKKVTNSANRQLGRQAIFDEDEKSLKKCFTQIKKRAALPLTPKDYRIFRAEVYLNYPESKMKQAPRLTGELKDLTPEQQQEERDYMKENYSGWSESRLRNFYEKHAKVKASVKK